MAYRKATVFLIGENFVLARKGIELMETPTNGEFISKGYTIMTLQEFELVYKPDFKSAENAARDKLRDTMNSTFVILKPCAIVRSSLAIDVNKLPPESLEQP